MNEGRLEVSSFCGVALFHALDVYVGGFRVRAAEVRDLSRAVALSSYAIMGSHENQPSADAMRRVLDAIRSGKQAAWVAEDWDELVGIALIRAENEVIAHLSLHVSPAIPEPHDITIALALAAIGGAWDAGYLKLIIHTDVPADRLIEPLHDRGFTFSRARSIGGEPVLEFYRDIYGKIPSFPIGSQHAGDGANPPAAGDWHAP